jgi:hypothetical protein
VHSAKICPLQPTCRGTPNVCKLPSLDLRADLETGTQGTSGVCRRLLSEARGHHWICASPTRAENRPGSWVERTEVEDRGDQDKLAWLDAIQSQFAGARDAGTLLESR